MVAYLNISFIRFTDTSLLAAVMFCPSIDSPCLLGRTVVPPSVELEL